MRTMPFTAVSMASGSGFRNVGSRGALAAAGAGPSTGGDTTTVSIDAAG